MYTLVLEQFCVHRAELELEGHNECWDPATPGFKKCVEKALQPQLG